MLPLALPDITELSSVVTGDVGNWRCTVELSNRGNENICFIHRFQFKNGKKDDKERFLDTINKKSDILHVSYPKRRNPNLLLKNIPNEIDDQEILQILKEQNPELGSEKLWEETKILFTVKKFENSRHLVLEVNPICRKICLTMKFLRVNLNIFRIEDLVIINRCFKYLGYHHKASNCENVLCCYNCGEEHKSRQCTLAIHVCLNCIRFNKKTRSPTKKLMLIISHNLVAIAVTNLWRNLSQTQYE
ncbi:hypothetical protein AVEN_143-1 [Araneus ventricosus]|uniref:CCHC-type domain-containing protein n=1 Tax=Araneus ventricosus TaxID=182803 RepID=A0A4Y2D254_ARAVE|nr:hypothetical protein AVEN_143-1 [Araneus ventricosus]